MPALCLVNQLTEAADPSRSALQVAFYADQKILPQVRAGKLSSKDAIKQVMSAAIELVSRMPEEQVRAELKEVARLEGGRRRGHDGNQSAKLANGLLQVPYDQLDATLAVMDPISLRAALASAHGTIALSNLGLHPAQGA